MERWDMEGRDAEKKAGSGKREAGRRGRAAEE